MAIHRRYSLAGHGLPFCRRHRAWNDVAILEAIHEREKHRGRLWPTPRPPAPGHGQGDFAECERQAGHRPQQPEQLMSTRDYGRIPDHGNPLLGKCGRPKNCRSDA